MLPFKLTEATLRRNVTEKSWERGQTYYRSGSVVNLLCRGNLIQALVEGNEYEPYRVMIQADRGGIQTADCSCSYDWGGWCKHIVAVGLACIQNPELVEEATPLEELLEPLDREQLSELIHDLVEEHPQVMDVVDAIATRLAALASPPLTVRSANSPPVNQVGSRGAQSRPRQRQNPIDPEPFRNQTYFAIQQALRQVEEGWDDGYYFVHDDFPTLLKTPEEFIERGDGGNARVMLAAITETCAENWGELDNYGQDGCKAILVLDPLWAEALLQCELDDAEAIDQQILLEEWGELLGGEFVLAAAALRQGWEDETLVAVLQGTEDILWEDEAPDYADALAQLRLRILARQERWEEYLNFAQAEGQDRDHLVKLVELGRGEAAIALLENLTTLEDAQSVAEAFRNQGDLSAALQVAQQGLNLPTRTDLKRESWRQTIAASPIQLHRQHRALAEWGAQLAEQVRNLPLALELWTLAIKAEPDVQNWQYLRRLAGEAWPDWRDPLLNYLERDYASYWVGDELTIFLAEDRVQAAMRRVAQAHDRERWLRVMDAAVAVDPDWVITQAKVKAEEILDRGKADRYDFAVRFLAQIKAAYLHQRDEAEWLRYRGKLMASHGRKYKLIGLMDREGL